MDDFFKDETYFKNANPKDLWVYDKLILSRKLGYNCGPVGFDVPTPGEYIVRPIFNIQGLGLGAEFTWIDRNTNHLPVGYFWCEVFYGRHYSIDYHYGEQSLAVEGISGNSLSQWKAWRKVDIDIPLPSILEEFRDQPWINCEFIGDNLIEVHMRRNPDFKDDSIIEYIPIFGDNLTDPPPGYEFIRDPELHGRIGAWIKKS